MNKNEKFNLGVYAFAGIMGVIVGSSYSKLMYFKGRKDHSEEVQQKLIDFAQGVEKIMEEHKMEEKEAE